jgi:predicted ATPase
MENNFKIIAIKTGKDGVCPNHFLDSSETLVKTNYLKSLQPNTVYSFYKQYSFPNSDFSKIDYQPSLETNPIVIKLSNNKKITININAIVGENGSGKSTLIELLYWINYNLGCRFGLLEYEFKKKARVEKYNINKDLDVELFYSINSSTYYLLKFKDGEIKQYQISFSANEFKETDNMRWQTISDIGALQDFFYSVVVNYSQYALNSLEIGEWINPLFHKNDGYQTPIVINPMRKDGNIDINRERLLLSRRLQSNVLERPKKDGFGNLRNLANGKIASKIKALYNPNYFEEILEDAEEIHDDLFLETFNAIKKISKIPALEDIDFPNTQLYEYEDDKDESFKRFVVAITNYVYYKLRKIANNYPIYGDYRDYTRIKNIYDLLKAVYESYSHISFKIKGAILHLIYYKEIYGQLLFGEYFKIDIEDFSLLIDEIKRNNKFYINTYMMALPSFFDVEIVPENDLTVGSFSSGEKQRIYSISSIIYHLINLNSVEQQKLLKGGVYTRYKYINLVLDEIEMYYHPEWQRTYISDLLNYIQNIDPRNLDKIEAINIIFITHSPFILSDIPNSNILYLAIGDDKKTKQEDSKKQTFAANIHDILATSFFLKKGFMGEFAKSRILELVKYIENKDSTIKSYEEAKLLMSIIGEPILKERLEFMLSQASKEKTKDEIIQDLQEEINKLKKNNNEKS